MFVRRGNGQFFMLEIDRLTAFCNISDLNAFLDWISSGSYCGRISSYGGFKCFSNYCPSDSLFGYSSTVQFGISFPLQVYFSVYFGPDVQLLLLLAILTRVVFILWVFLSLLDNHLFLFRTKSCSSRCIHIAFF